MEKDIYLITTLIIAGFTLTGWYISRKMKELQSPTLEEEKTKKIINQVFGEITQKVTEQAKSVLSADKDAIYKDNAHKREIIEKLITDLKREIDDRQSEIRELEKDRNKKFGDITRAIEEHRLITQELKTSTQSLGRMLSNNQVRGAWGEKIIEEILKNAGLIENIHYQKQKALGSTAVKPDITLLLPNGRKVSVDVKFPYSQMQNAAETQVTTEKKEFLKLFEKDVREKLTQIEKRGYINPAEGTLDYAIMFVPNEMLFSFINQKFPDLIDEAMQKKIMIVSPFTFLIVARTVMESYKNFMMENNLKKIIQHIQAFSAEWEHFTTEFNKFDDSINKLRDLYDQISQTRYKKMKLRIKQVDDYQQLTNSQSNVHELNH